MLLFYNKISIFNIFYFLISSTRHTASWKVRFTRCYFLFFSIKNENSFSQVKKSVVLKYLIDSGISPLRFCLPSDKLKWINQFLFWNFFNCLTKTHKLKFVLATVRERVNYWKICAKVIENFLNKIWRLFCIYDI